MEIAGLLHLFPEVYMHLPNWDRYEAQVYGSVIYLYCPEHADGGR